MNHRDALVESKSDVDKLISYTKEKLSELASFHEQYEETMRKSDEGWGSRRITPESRELSDEFRDARDSLGKHIESELAAISQLLWKQITRPEEQRKFRQMRNALEKVVYPFLGDPDDYYHEDMVNIVIDPSEYVESTLKALRYLKNYWHRIERYQKVQREIPHGPFTLINEYGYQPGEYDKELAYFDKAATLVKKIGFGKLLYGKVLLTTTSTLGENTIGMYDPRMDGISLAVDWVSMTKDKREGPVPILIHEFGHRLWQKFLPTRAKSNYVLEYGWISGADVAAWWERLVANNFVLAKTTREVDLELVADEIAWRWKKAVKATTDYQEISVKQMRQILRSGKDMPIGPESSQWRVIVKPEAVLKQLKRVFFGLGMYHQETVPLDYYKPRTPVPARSVTWYGETDPEEDFCEAFMFYCMGWKMEPEFENRLVDALSKVDA